MIKTAFSPWLTKSLSKPVKALINVSKDQTILWRSVFVRMRVSIRQNCAIGTYRKCLKVRDSESLFKWNTWNFCQGFGCCSCQQSSRVSIIPHSRNYRRNGYKLSAKRFPGCSAWASATYNWLMVALYTIDQS